MLKIAKRLLILQLLLFAVFSLESQIALSGSEMLVNTATTNSQQWVSATMDNSGNYVIVWESANQDGSGFGIYLQIFDNSNSPLGIELRANSTTTDDQRFPTVCADTAGNFVVVWQSFNQDGDGWGVYGQRYGNTGSTIGGEFLINSISTGQQKRPRVAMDDSGNFAVVWESELDIKAQLYNNLGSAIGSEFTVNTTTSGAQMYPDIAMDSDGDFVVVWQSFSQDGDDFGIYLQRFDDTGSMQGIETQVNTTTSNAQLSPRVSSDDNGNFVIVWVSNTQDGSQEGIYGQRFDNTGTPLGSEFKINSNTSGAQDNPDVQMNSAGDFLVCWNSFNQDGNYFGVYAQLFHNLGYFIGDETVINITTNNFQQFPAVVLNNTNAVFAWQDGERNTMSSFDGNNFGIVKQTAGLAFDCDQPIAICKNHILQLENSGNAILDPSDIDNGSNAVCGPSVLSTSPINFACANLGNNIVSLTITDATGNTSSCMATLTIEDNVAPVAVCQNLNVYLNAGGNGFVSANDVDNGSTDACGISTRSLSKTSFNCTDLGENTVTLSVTDVNDNTGTCSATITVLDTVSPSALCTNLNVYLNSSGTGSVSANDVDNGSTDACGINTSSLSKTGFNCTNVGPNLVILAVTDLNGNTGYCGSIITVLDTVSPNAVCQNITIYLNPGGTRTITGNDLDNGSNDACGLSNLTANPSSFDCSGVGANSVTLVVTDQNGNISGCSATVNVLDTVSPTAICQNYTLQLAANGNGMLTGNDVNNGSADACGLSNLSVSPSSFNCSDLGAHSVILSVLDANGNTNNCSATVTVEDNVPPFVLCQNITVYLDASGSQTVYGYDIDVGSLDACGIGSLSASPSAFTCADVGPNAVTLTVYDVNGNSNTCVATVTVLDTTSPNAVCQNISIYLNAAGTASLTGNDVDGGSTDACGLSNLNVNPSAFSCDNVGANPVTLYVTDNNGNTTSCNATVTVLDTVSPNAICKNYALQLNANGDGAITPADVNNGSSDACGISSLSVSRSSFDCDDLGNVPVTLTVTDVNGNTSSCTATITVVDMVTPIVTCQDITVYLNAAGTASANPFINGALISRSDNCNLVGGITVTGPNPYSCNHVNNPLLNLRMRQFDLSGNYGDCFFDVTVLDTITPISMCKNITIQLDTFGNTTLDPEDMNDGSSDNCAITFSASQTAFNCNHVGTNNVTMTAIDASNNESSCSSTVTVEDNIMPAALCSNITVQLDNTGNASIVADDVDNGSYDACGILSRLISVSSFDCLSVGTNNVVLTVNDNNGNTNSCTAVVTVEDNIQPTAICKNLSLELDSNGEATLNPEEADNGSSDACGIASFQLTPPVFNCAHLGTTGAVLSVTDNNGNTNTCSTMVTVTDYIIPTITCPDDITVLTEPNECSVPASEVDLGSPAADDNCTVQYPLTNNAPFDFPLGKTNVKWFVKDQSNNKNNCIQKVTVQASSCAQPIQVLHTDTTESTARIIWQESICATNYQLRIRQELLPGVWGSWSPWQNYSGPGLEHTFTNLNAGKFHHYQIRSKCFTTNSTIINGWFWTLISNSLKKTSSTQAEVFSEVNSIDWKLSQEVVQTTAVLQVVPNPANDWLEVKLKSFQLPEVRLHLMDLNGNQIFDIVLPYGDTSVELDLNQLNLKSGLYFISAGDSKQEVTRQVLIIK